MGRLRIYGSQGHPIGDERAPPDDRIQDFFFDGVRLALDQTGGTVEAIVFFRARDSQASRSEQYYAEYKAQSVREVARELYTELQTQLRDQHGLELVTSTEDTTILRLLDDASDSREPTSKDLDDVNTLLDSADRSGGLGVGTTHQSGTSRSDPLGGNRGPDGPRGIGGIDPASAVDTPRPIKLGVDSYESAFGTFRELVSNDNSIAITENADSSRLDSYDVVIEKGNYTGVTLLGSTRTAVDDLREERRKQRQRMMGTGDDSPLPDIIADHKLAFGVFGAVLGLVLIAGLITAVGCTLQIPFVENAVPVCGDVPESSGDPLEFTNGPQYHGGNSTLTFKLGTSGNTELPDDAVVQFMVLELGDGTPAGPVENVTRDVGNSSYPTELPLAEPLDNGTYELTVVVTDRSNSRAMTTTTAAETATTTSTSPTTTTTVNQSQTTTNTTASEPQTTTEATPQRVVTTTGDAINWSASGNFTVRNGTETKTEPTTSTRSSPVNTTTTQTTTTTTTTTTATTTTTQTETTTTTTQTATTTTQTETTATTTTTQTETTATAQSATTTT